MQINSQKGFEDLIYADKIKLKKDTEQYEQTQGEDEVLLRFHSAPYESLLDKLRKQVYSEKQEHTETHLFLRFKDTGDTWDLGYIHMTLDFWKEIEDIFYNYEPTFFKIGEDKLKRLGKVDYIHTASLKGSELDGFIE